MFMTQASHAKPTTSPTTSLGAAAAAAATGNGAAKPDDKAAKPAKPPKPPRKKAADMTEAEKAEAKAERLANALKVFIVVGTTDPDGPSFEVHEFETIGKAEKFLNSKDAPASYTALRGKRIGTNRKVSLR